VSSGRLEAFSDGVIAILITIMVLELGSPEGADLDALSSLVPQILTYALSFVYIGIYWVNHHHMFQATERVSGRILWVNLLLLFWLSMVPFATAWMNENYREALPVAVYGIVMLVAAISGLGLQRAIISFQGADSRLREALGSDAKGKATAVLYVSAICLAFLNTWLSIALYVTVALMWMIPDRRIESVIER
jgi:uncharacterized membrane protein